MTTVVEWTDVAPLALEGRPRRIVPLVLGFEPISEAISMRGGSSFRHLLEPVTAAAVEFDSGWVLLDGGFDPARVRDPALRAASFGYENYLPVVPPGDPLVDQIAEAGLEWDDLAAAAITHAHFDHTGAARLLRSSQPLLVQRREWEHVCTTPSERDAFLFRDDFAHPDLTIAVLDGDVELAAGLRAIDTAGHTPGHQSFVVEWGERVLVLAGDAADLRVNIERRVPTGSTSGADGEHLADRAIQRLADLDGRPGTEVWPSHDPDWQPWREIVDGR
ncbi:N-acyl homoserine lactonase family protein [Microbacterium allomyrinae]|uniref:N-acyl homoserine lactonase family protein n=1 Tax=Microbacterium allomyrinae TaxID=2830666 RepID=A0A9X1LVL1_9MICO|nr:N-acyl homoserine lactonase family protein [Microbacterium allomyrinae]MCC2032468.1 N-acyl homoserine lactonase family protein [Microbacterium allomyrinae]